MELLTHDNRRLRVLTLGEPEAKDGSDIIKCEDKNGKRVDVKTSSVKKLYGSIALPPSSNKTEKNEI